MTLICYDISNTRTRTKLSKYLEKYGRRVQNSVFEINQPKNIIHEIKSTIKLQFTQRVKNKDSIMIIPVFPSLQKSIVRIGTKAKEEKSYVTIIS
jgi:CRISPR-associated protein Cas2